MNEPMNDIELALRRYIRDDPDASITDPGDLALRFLAVQLLEIQTRQPINTLLALVEDICREERPQDYPDEDPRDPDRKWLEAHGV